MNFALQVKRTLFIALIFTPLFALGEYRAYLLKLENQTTKTVRMITSTLDHFQYPRYYTVDPNERITLAETWMCYGNTSDFEDICTKPIAASNMGAPSASPSTAPASLPTGSSPATAPAAP